MPTFQTPDPITVTVDVPCGDVVVTAADRADTVVEIRPTDPSSKSDIRAAEQMTAEFVAGALTVRSPKSKWYSGAFSGKSSVQVRIQVPAGSELKASTALGRLVGAGDLGECDLEVAAGDITVERPRGSVTAKTAKGDIRIGEAARGVFQLETSMGELVVGVRAGTAAHLETFAAYGSITNDVAAAAAAGDDTVRVFARNMYGDITIGHATVAA
ncbi:hypothetical protein ACFWM1_33650 [Nocardia sp. NPDC058379]|uniref:hypothetical protein n=1 Tax=unclassified Nocardia TaxID=2637762 RepID=UPI003665E184